MTRNDMIGTFCVLLLLAVAVFGLWAVYIGTRVYAQDRLNPWPEGVGVSDYRQLAAPPRVPTRHDGTQARVDDGYGPELLRALVERTGAFSVVERRELVGVS